MTLNWRRRRKLPPAMVTAVDYAESMLAGARKRFAKNPFVTVQHADAAHLPFGDAAFSTACVANAVHCFPDAYSPGR
jgi:ubiquinone/menaquinone biosynthesis C-methylase UbiE